MPSTFTWLDYSEHERRKMLDVIELFGEKTTRDELGLGGVRDAFADLLFPGTSTIQTRAKYYLFVPWVYLQLEEAEIPTAKIAQRDRKEETNLMLAIEQTSDATGLIGRRAKENVRRLASSVYWQGMMTWGIRIYPGSQDEYHRSLDVFYKRRKGRKASRQEYEGESFHEPDLHNWHTGLPVIPPDFPKGITFALEPNEATYLRERVLTSCPHSLMAFILREKLPMAEIPECWDLAASVTPELREQLEHGRNFSEAMHGAQVLYNLMLAEIRPWPEREQEYREMISDWQEMIRSRHFELAAWDRKRFWQIVHLGNPRISQRAVNFINGWIDLVLQSSGETDFSKSVPARRLVELRERQLKKGQSRFQSRRALELWSGAAGVGQMDLRWNAARRILNDILQGLENKNA